MREVSPIWCWVDYKKQQRVGHRWGLTTLRGDYTTVPKSIIQKLEVGLSEESLCRAFWVAGVGDNNIEFVGAVCEELEAIAYNGLNIRVLEAN